ncbi:MAG: right-handed parallel beta-helix repeat-containing protein [Oscillospiraceae bacterium]|jgi:hypothetical protein|nr:right-handed parallel beta-helix repeat-containing protein [Oscillospiraceae bacterium]
MSDSLKPRKGLYLALPLLAAAGLAAALAWYYDAYVNWQPKVFSYTLVALSVGIIALTLLALWARGERKATALLWKTALSLIAFTGVSLCGVSYIINNVIGKEAMARQASMVALPLAAAQILVLCVLSLRSPGKRVARKWIALTAAGAAAILLVVVGAGVAVPWYYRTQYRAPAPQIQEGRFAPMPQLEQVDYTVPADGTIEQVRDLIRQERENGSDRHYTVLIEDGEYSIKQIAFDARDHDTTYRSRGGGVILNGGMRLRPADFTRWEKNENIQVIDLTKLGLDPEDWGKMYSLGAFTTAEKYDGGVGPLPCELFFNGRRCVTARYPNGSEWLEIGKVIDNGDSKETYGNGTVVNPDWPGLHNPRGGAFEMDKATAARAASWATLDDVWMFGCFMHEWADMSTPVKAVDKAAGTVTTEYASFYGFKPGRTYYFYNVLEELDEPGEWYLDRKAGLLYFWPPEGDFDGASIDISLSIETLISGENLKNMSFIGFALQGTRGDGVNLRGDGLTVDHCLVQNLAGSAIALEGYNNTASNNEVLHVGKAGISIGGGDAAALAPGNSRAVNNLVHDWSETFIAGQGGVSLGGTGNLAAHNELYNAPNTAIFFGGNNHVIEYNDIHDVCLLTDDAGAIYCGRSFYAAQGSAVRYNAIYNLGSGDHRASGNFHPNGVYLDDGLAGVAVLGNLLVNVPGDGIQLSGRDLDVRGNILANVGTPVRYNDRTREAALTDNPNHWFYAHTGPGGDMWANLEASPWRTDAWKAAFPKLAALSTDFADIESPAFAANPAGSTVAGNVFAGANKPYYSESVLRFSKIGPNRDYGLAQMKAIFADAAKGDYRVLPGSKVYKDFPAWEDIEIERIGRVG